MAKTINWGIMSTGNIARRFAESLGNSETGRLAAVGSRSRERAAEFAERYGAARSHGSYEELAGDPDVDAIYVATPHPYHAENTLLCAEAGKHVLCEKPLAMNAREASSMVDAVRKHGVFLMEAMWTRFLPAVREVKRIIEDGAIGTPRSFLASFGFRAAYNPQGRLFDPALGGGALLDLGIYPVSFAAHMLGSIQTALGIADYAPSGVDHNFSASLLHADGGISAVHGATSINTLGTGFVYGESGMIEIHGAFFHPHSFTLRRDGKQEVRIERPYQDPGYQYEIDAVGEALSRGELEHPLMPLDESVQIMNTLDQIRANWKLPYD